MPSNKNAVIRYKFLDELLKDRVNEYTCIDLLNLVNKRLHDAGFPEIGGEKGDYDRYLKSGKRVIQMDLQALQEAPFNLEIDSSRKRYGAPIYRYVDQTKSLFHTPLSNDEKRLLQEVLNTLGQFSGLDNFQWLNDLQEKLNDQYAFGEGQAVSREGDGSPLEGYGTSMGDRRKIIAFGANEFLKGVDFLGPLFTLISNKKVVDVVYEPFGEPARTIRMYPYLLKQSNNRWYLIGTPLATEENPYIKNFFINLSLDRMVEVKAVENEPYIDCDEDFEERYEDIIGVTWMAEVPLTQVVMAVKNGFVPFVETKPFHGSQMKFSAQEQLEFHQKYPNFEGYSFYGLEVKPNRELYNALYSYGSNIIVVSPDEIRQKMLKELSESVEKLKGN